MTHDRAEFVDVYFGQSDDGKWVAASGSSPYFFFECKTEEEAKSLAQEAIRFYTENRDKIPAESARGDQARELPTFSNVKTEKLCA